MICDCSRFVNCDRGGGSKNAPGPVKLPSLGVQRRQLWAKSQARLSGNSSNKGDVHSAGSASRWPHASHVRCLERMRSGSATWFSWSQPVQAMAIQSSIMPGSAVNEAVHQLRQLQCNVLPPGHHKASSFRGLKQAQEDRGAMTTPLEQVVDPCAGQTDATLARTRRINASRERGVERSMP